MLNANIATDSARNRIRNLPSDKAFAEIGVLRVDLCVPLAEVGARIDVLTARVDAYVAALTCVVVSPLTMLTAIPLTGWFRKGALGNSRSGATCHNPQMGKSSTCPLRSVIDGSDHGAFPEATILTGRGIHHVR